MLLKLKEDMTKEEKLLKRKNKLLHKSLLLTVKLIPIIMAFLCLANSILSYFNIDIVLFSYIGSCSLLSFVFFYISSYVFKFCEYHRMFIHYTLVVWIINIYDYYIGIPINDLNYLCLQMIITGISLFIILYLYLKHK